MSWDTAKTAAAHLLKDAPPDFHGAFVAVTSYADEATKNFLEPKLPWSLEFYTMVGRAFAREVRRRHGHPVPVIIELNQYFDWLVKTKKENCGPARAQYVAEQVEHWCDQNSPGLQAAIRKLKSGGGGTYYNLDSLDDPTS